MATISLTDPVAGTQITAGLHAANNSALRTAINGGLDNTNFAATAWTPYTPTLTGSTGGAPAVGNGTLTFRFIQIGKTVSVRGTFTLGGTTVLGTGSIELSLPVGAKDGTGFWGTGTVYDTSANAITVGYVQSSAASTTKATLVYTTAAVNGTPTVITPALPFAWATGDQIVWLLQYEAA